VVSGNEDHWDKAFQLAFFIVPDRALAHEIAGRAIEKLGVQRSRERRRIYWRIRNVKLRIRRITRTDEDALQWLVYLEAEVFEKEQEQGDRQTEIDMVIRYVKHLVQLTTGASSFYVNVGLNRLLRNYTTPEVQQIYEFTTEHYPASEEYRKVKGRLMNELTRRFGPLIKVRTSEYRELKFEAYEDQKRWVSIVEECLESFTPWSSRRACLTGKSKLAIGEPWTGVQHRPSQKDGIETDRCHWFMHSPCYAELARRFEFDSPEERLSVPQFFLANNNRQDGGSSNTVRKVSPLTDAEKKVLKGRIESSEARRRRAPTQVLKIVAHGVGYAQFNPYRNEKRRFEIPDGIRLLEVLDEIDSTDLTIATLWIDYTESAGIDAREYTVSLAKGRELVFRIIPATVGSEAEGRAVVEVESRPRSSLTALQRSGSLMRLNGRVPQYAVVAALLVCLGWLAATVHYRLTQQESIIQRMSKQTAAVVETKPHAQEQNPPHIATYFLSSEIPTVRGTGNPQESVVSFAPGDSLVMLNLPTPQPTGSFQATLSSFLDEQELLRQNQLKPVKTDKGWVVSFPLPSSAVTNDTDYLITLALQDKTGKATAVSRFLFKVRK
jgi:hypothetical protein